MLDLHPYVQNSTLSQLICDIANTTPCLFATPIANLLNIAIARYGETLARQLQDVRIIEGDSVTFVWGEGQQHDLMYTRDATVCVKYIHDSWGLPVISALLFFLFWGDGVLRCCYKHYACACMLRADCHGYCVALQPLPSHFCKILKSIFGLFTFYLTQVLGACSWPRSPPHAAGTTHAKDPWQHGPVCEPVDAVIISAFSACARGLVYMCLYVLVYEKKRGTARQKVLTLPTVAYDSAMLLRALRCHYLVG